MRDHILIVLTIVVPAQRGGGIWGEMVVLEIEFSYIISFTHYRTLPVSFPCVRVKCKPPV